MMNITEYEYLWTTEKEKWVLVNSSYGYGIINKATQSMLMVSDDELEKALIDHMLAEGCKTYDNIKDAYADV
ncbi:MAG: hypothetical protein K6C13_08560 [Oscillospiraceae bacterium]|nr:hypothetical protein [Oscillospiraceae bacterium]